MSKRSADREKSPAFLHRYSVFILGCAALGALAASVFWRPTPCTADAEGDPKTGEELSIKLDIYHGQFGGIADKAKGATTVANKNDTDGDGTVDNADQVVKTTGTTLSSDALQGTRRLTVASLSGFSPGMIVMIQKADDATKWEVGQVSSIGLGTLNLGVGVQKDYAAGDLVFKPEVDLMKLVLHKPSQDLGGNVTLSELSGAIKVWERPTKETEVTLPKQYTVAELTNDKTLWLEATDVSPSIQDQDKIQLKVEYQTASDTVKATAAWCEKVDRSVEEGKNPWLERAWNYDGFPDNPVVGPGGDLPELDLGEMVTFINDKSIAVDGSRYGFGYLAKFEGSDNAIGGRALYEFQLLPAGVETLGVKVDCTRQIWAKTWTITVGEKDPQLLPEWVRRWPWDEQENPPRDKEEANDDGPKAVEDNLPSGESHYVYAYDSPSNSVAAGSLAFKIFRTSLKSWTRITLNQTLAPPSLNDVEGSQSSDKADWHLVMYVRRRADGKFEKDDTAKGPSACAPTSHEKGQLSVAVNETNCQTEGWTVTYAQDGNAWDVSDTARIRGTLFFVENSNPRQWRGDARVDGNVWASLTVTENAGKTFATGDQFKFSTFRSGETVTGKCNRVGTGAFPVDGEGGTVP